MAKVEFHFDFGSPNAYLAHLIVPEIEQRIGVEFEYVPILLGGVFKLTNNRSPVEKLAGIKNRLEYEQLEMRRFIRRHGITQFTWNPFFPVNTLLIMRGAVAAQLDNVFDRYVDAVFKAMWAEQKKMDDAEVAAAVLQQAGLDGARLARAHAGARGQGPSAEEHRGCRLRAARSAPPLSLSATRSSSARIGCAMSRRRSRGPQVIIWTKAVCVPSLSVTLRCARSEPAKGDGPSGSANSP